MNKCPVCGQPNHIIVTPPTTTRPHVGISSKLARDNYESEGERAHYLIHDRERQIIIDGFWYDLINERIRANIDPATIWASGLSYILPWTWRVEFRTRRGRLIYLENFLRVERGAVVPDRPGPLMWVVPGHEYTLSSDLKSTATATLHFADGRGE